MNAPNNGLHLLKNPGSLGAMCGPTGRWFLVGTVPVHACYARKDGAPLTADDIAAIRHAGPGFAPVKRRTFDTKDQALAAAAEVL
jgi:hypothetical protein